jgi:putative ABC transport system permease protein
MDLWQSAVEAFESLLSNKLRSGLTVLGVVIGVGAVIAMLAIGRGAQNTITGSINDIGTNLVFIVSGGNEDVRNPQPLTVQDAAALSDAFAAPSVAGTAPVLSERLEATFGADSTLTEVEGVTSQYFSLSNLNLTEGEAIDEVHVLGRAAVAVIAPDAADELFGRHSGIVGETIRIEGQPFRVLGVTQAKGGSGFANQDNRIYIPMTTAQARLIRRPHVDEVDMIIAQATSADTVSAATEEISTILRSRHRTAVGKDDFTIFTQQDFLSTAETITNVLTLFLGGIAAISLLVGGIGIMNIMLVSVTERTREIGLRKAVGARKRDILLQFLTESSLLSLSGGVLGILLGWGLSSAVGAIASASDTSLIPQMTPEAILLATLFSLAVGVFFGLYPAKRAADLEPAEALRYE